MPRSHRPTVLCILDGWGTRPNTPDNAIAQAETPVWDALLETCPHGTLASSGEAVGLPPGQMGNSEVGHMNLGAGRVVMQDLPRIDKAIQDGSLAKNRTLRDIIATLHKTGGTCHLTGLVSPGGVHSHQRHFVALARFLSEEGIPVSIHAFMDGRDTPPSSGKGYLQALQKDLEEMKNVSISTVSGRFYAMDRDKRWERVEKAWRALVLAEGTPAASPIAAMEDSYAEGITDEFVVPAVMDGYTGMAAGDGVIMVNFRADRAREIMAALCDRNFSGFPRPAFPELAACGGMTEYAAEYKTFLDTIFPPESLTGLLGEVVAADGGSQLRIAETEKYAHVTFFFNGGEETAYEGEERILVPSPRVATYDMQPEMSAPEVSEKLAEAVKSKKFDLIVCNFANGDMVGHTGILEAAVKAVETVDSCLGTLKAAVESVGGALLITADHGNSEKMRDPETGAPHTAHTTGEVPLVLVAPESEMTLKDKGRLADVAPSILDLMGLEVPAEMTGLTRIVRTEE